MLMSCDNRVRYHHRNRLVRRYLFLRSIHLLLLQLRLLLLLVHVRYPLFHEWYKLNRHRYQLWQSLHHIQQGNGNLLCQLRYQHQLLLYHHNVHESIRLWFSAIHWNLHWSQYIKRLHLLQRVLEHVLQSLLCWYLHLLHISFQNLIIH